MAGAESIIPAATLASRPKPRERILWKPARTVKKTTRTTITFEKVWKSIEEHREYDRDKLTVANKRAKKTSQKVSKKEAKVDLEALSRRVRGMSVQPEDEEEDSGDEFARQMEASFDQASDEMEDTAPTKRKTEQEEIDEAWAAFDAAVAEDPTLISKPKPRVPSMIIAFQGPQSRKRKRDSADDFAHFDNSLARFRIKLKLSFDVSGASKSRQSRNMHYEVDGRDASTIRKLFNTFWLEEHEWLVHRGYNLERVKQVKRLDIKLLLKEGSEVRSTRCWTISGDFEGKAQSKAWGEFMDAARKQGSREALDHLKMVEREERIMRKTYLEDEGRLYNHAGVVIEMKKWYIHATVEPEIVLHFD